MNQKGFTQVIIFLVVLALLAIGGIAYYKYPNLLNKNTEQPKESQIYESKDWRGYKNNEYGFQIEYPITWKIEETKHTPKPEGWLFSTTLSAPDGESLIDIIVSADPNKKIANYGELSSFKGSKGSLNDIPAWVENVEGTFKATVYSFSSPIEGQAIQVSAGSVNDLATVNKIISTFKFDETINWKTYTSPDGTFNFKYPPSWYPDVVKSPLGESVNFFLNGTKPIYGSGEGDVESNYVFSATTSKDFRTLEQIKNENYLNQYADLTTFAGKPALKTKMAVYVELFNQKQLTLNYAKVEPSSDRTFQLILSTFKFSN